MQMSEHKPMINNDSKTEDLKKVTQKRRHAPGPEGRMMGGEKAKNFKGTIVKLAKFMAPFKFQIAFAILFAIGSVIFNVIGPKVLSNATTELFCGAVAKMDGTGSINFSAIASTIVIALVLYVVSSACNFIEGWLMTSVTQRTCYKLRQAFSQKINRMPMAYFEKTSTGDTLSRITNDVDTLGQNLNQGITRLITSSTTIIGVLIMMLVINPLMTGITLLILPVSAVFIALIVKASQKHFKAQQKTLGAINAKVEETFAGHVVVKAFCKEETTKQQFSSINNKLYESAWKSQFLSGLMMPVMTFVSNLGYVGVAIAGGILASSGIITVGDIQAFVQYVENFTRPITELSQVGNVFQQMAAAAERIFEFLEEDELEAESPTPEIQDMECSIEFNDVNFGYSAEHAIIHDFTASVKEGQTVALVGPTGAGKTTIVKLLMRFYDPTSGKIMLGANSLTHFNRHDVRSQFGMVLQDTWLFNGTIKENIAYGKLDATMEEIQAAAKAARVEHFISTLPQGYDTVINEAATNISQGQRQLLTIARAILANRRMLILDEATSNVDSRTEEQIQQAMDNLMAGRTSFVIAHRLSTIKNADLILVIDGGTIVEQGNHAQLLERGGFYANLYNSQFEKVESE